MSISRRLVLAGALLAVPLGAAGAYGAAFDQRTARLSSAPTGASGDGGSTNPVLSANGRVVAFDTSSTDVTGEPDPNGSVRDVVMLDFARGTRRLVSRGGDGPSFDPSLDARGRRVAFMSQAANLVTADRNAKTDIFLRDGDLPPIRVSVRASGGDPNGASSQPDISADGRYVAFASTASNLVAGDRNGRSDVFVRDTLAGTTRMISRGGRGTSITPAISGDGRFVSFFSSDPDLVRRDKDRHADVFVANARSGRIERVSVTSAGTAQNASIARPFSQVSDLSRDGRFVVFDSDATNLVRGDTNRDTDVFLRDRRRARTTRISLTATGRQGANDSFSPSITANGNLVAFESFAENLAPGTAKGEDVFVFDRRSRTTAVIDVGQDGRARGPELVKQLLQKPMISEDGGIAAFTSTARGLVGRDANSDADVFARVMAPPRGVIVRSPPAVSRQRRPPITLAADDRAATRFVCRIDEGRPFLCPRGDSRLPRVGDGRHTLLVRAGGPGMLFDPEGVRARFDVDRTGPVARTRRPRGSSVRTLRGSARDRSGVKSVEVAVVYFGADARCHEYDGKGFKTIPCRRGRFLPADGGRSWRLRLPRAIDGPIAISVRATDALGNRGRMRDTRTIQRG